MSVEAATAFVAGLGLYGLAGFAFALAFVAGLARRIDPEFKDATLPARAMIFWGALALWPLMLMRVVFGSRPA